MPKFSLPANTKLSISFRTDDPALSRPFAMGVAKPIVAAVKAATATANNISSRSSVKKAVSLNRQQAAASGAIKTFGKKQSQQRSNQIASRRGLSAAKIKVGVLCPNPGSKFGRIVILNCISLCYM